MTQLMKTAAFACLFAGLTAVSAAASPAPSTTEAVLERWLAALGGRAAVESVRATYVWSRVSAGGTESRSEEWNTARGELRAVIDYNSFRRVSGFDGSRGFAIDENRKVRMLTGAALEALRSEGYLAANAQFFPGRVAGRVRYLG